MSIDVARGVVYMVVNGDVTGAEFKAPSFTFEFGPKRRTIKWKGRKFNVPTYHVVRVSSP